jgi:hypothetical protein
LTAVSPISMRLKSCAGYEHAERTARKLRDDVEQCIPALDLVESPECKRHGWIQMRTGAFPER